MTFFFRQRTAQRGDAGAHHIHRMRGSRQRFQHGAYVSRQSAQRFEFAFIGGEFIAGG
ncbi:hypothetical protein SDC9_191921 [bioreactor metagenome]|uniref:Uncharacterized protein n=1 Tax=bioreactor metagenome TaxID=1076179 RepID=A0A645I0H8_9ZZZZ